MKQPKKFQIVFDTQMETSAKWRNTPSIYVITTKPITMSPDYFK